MEKNNGNLITFIVFGLIITFIIFLILFGIYEFELNKHRDNYSDNSESYFISAKDIPYTLVMNRLYKYY